MKTIRVLIGNRLVGELGATANRSIFIYAKDFLAEPMELSPLVMTSRAEPYVFEGKEDLGLPPLVRDSLPGYYAAKVMRQWFAHHFSPKFEVSYLEQLSYVGYFGMGALVYEPAKDFPAKLLRTYDLKKQERLSKALKPVDLDAVRFSTRTIGGARPKSLVCRDLATGNFYLDDPRLADEKYQHLVLKYGIPPQERSDLNNYPEIEHSYHQVAQRCGINTAQTLLLPSANKKFTHFGSVRFDQVKGQRIHMATLRGLMGVDSARHQFTYGELLETTRKLTRNLEEMKEVYRRMVFNVLAHCCDDHERNHSFLMDSQGRWSLSPAYDLSFTDNHSWFTAQDQAMLIHGKVSGISSKDLVAEGERAGLGGRYCRDTIQHIAEELSGMGKRLLAHGLQKEDARKIQEKLIYIAGQVGATRQSVNPSKTKPRPRSVAKK